MRIQLQATARDQKPVLLRLMELYCYDFSEFLTWPLRADGTFCNPQRFEARWNDKRVGKYLVLVEGAIAGFVLVREGSPLSTTALSTSLPASQTGDSALIDPLSNQSGTHDIDEFFIMRGYRRRGIGRIVARSTFELHRGPWQMRVLQENTVAQAFWRHVIGDYTNGNWSESSWKDKFWQGQIFGFDNSIRPALKVL
ncbi:MAG: hypothetical protein JWN98_512 [Abditibacteriota bacterium]|nr:hypothetical protein [Abditibacteriota bacterium]